MKYISYTPKEGNKAQEKYRFLIHGKIIVGWTEGETYLQIDFKAPARAMIQAKVGMKAKVVDKPNETREWFWRGEKSGIEDYEEVIAYLVSLKLPGHEPAGASRASATVVQPPLF